MTDLLPRIARALMVFGGIGLLAGCVYDPYTGTYYPCCANPYPHYVYPEYPAYGPYPYNYPPPYPPPGYPPPEYAPAPPGGAGMPGTGASLGQRFANANVTQDGRLTLQQAEAANWQTVSRNFTQIDIGEKGYVTLDDIRVWLAAHRPPTGGARG